MKYSKTILITGGTRGVGKVISEHFLSFDYNLVICSSNYNSVENAKKYFSKYNKRVLVLKIDISLENEVLQLFHESKEKFKKIDVLVNCAGVHTPIGKVYNNESDEWKRSIEINLLGPFYTCKYLIPEMIKNNFGRIINLSGGGATKSMPHFSAYAAAKAGLVRFTETVADELRDYNITVNAVAPGFIATDIHKSSISAGERILGNYYWWTKDKLEKGGDDPIKTAKLIEFLSSNDCKISGKLISAIHDKWEKFNDNDQISKDMFTLRRVDDFFIVEK